MTSKSNPRQPYVKQHYVPQFLLRAWHSAPDEMLSVHQRLCGVFLERRATAKSVGYLRHLYSFPRPGGLFDTSVERDFMGPHVDGPAAAVHAKILATGIRSLDDEGRGYWAQFVVSMLLRIPRTMEHLHERAIKHLGDQLDEDPEFARQYDPDTTTRQWVDKHYPEAYAEVAIRTLPMLIQSEKLMAAVTTGSWATRTLNARCPFTFVLGDRPLLYLGTLETRFLIVLPLSPRTAFIFFNDQATWQEISTRSDANFAKATNMESVTAAARYVYASDARHSAFIERYLVR